MIREGTYKAKASHWWWEQSNNGNYYLTVVFPLPPENDTEGSEDASVMARLFFTDAAVDRSVESLRYLGWTGDDIAKITDGVGGLDANEVSIVVEHESYTDDKGQEHQGARVRWINRPRSAMLGPRNAPPAEDLARFASGLRGRVAAVTASLKNGSGAQTGNQGNQGNRGLPPSLVAFAAALARANGSEAVAAVWLDHIRALNAAGDAAKQAAWKDAQKRAGIGGQDLIDVIRGLEKRRDDAKRAPPPTNLNSDGTVDDDVPF